MKRLLCAALVWGVVGLLPSTASATSISLSVCGNADGSKTGCLGGSIDMVLTSVNDQLTVVATNNLTGDASANIESLGFNFTVFWVKEFGSTLASATTNLGSVNTSNINVVNGVGGNFFVDFGFSGPGGPAADAFGPTEQITVILNTFLEGTNTPATINLDGGVRGNVEIQTSNLSNTQSNGLPTSVPEPSSALLLGLGAVLVGYCGRRRRADTRS